MAKNLLTRKAEFDVIIMTNSPGELSALARPTIEKLHAELPRARIILILTPCQYASGREIDYANTIPGISRIITPKEYKKWLFLNKKPIGIRFNPKGIVIFLGGDLFHSIFIAKRLRFKAMAYVLDRIGWKRSFTKFLVPDERTYKKFKRLGLTDKKLNIIGDLMVDSINTYPKKEDIIERNNLKPNKKIVTFLPGSRPLQTKNLLPFYVDIIDLLNSKTKEAQYVLSVSPFTAIDDLANYVKGKGKLVTESGLSYIISNAGNRVLVSKALNYEVISISDLCVTVPGTNTAQVAALGKPMLVVFPFNKPEVLPVEGLLGLITSIPILGVQLKRMLVKIVNENTDFFALPNIKAEKEIVPEIRGVLTPSEVAESILSLLRNQRKLDQMSAALTAIMGEKGAAANLLAEVKLLIREEVSTK
ncbi:MAG: hypothetical protein KKB81_03090 [Candidatus Margulisbacteria bacterium]|nr:hypothetical protein [Candidatus Margulisiibacteriota bacterium]MBU1022230.1 hypothetical protein [Candidatus Margulisiibacteriota bacterium]MBU1729331.1 hypothetical protein [Candidatus Margulisiibacteriota bacterium]MBU1955604.1 hypothetical protein [Candidatus Margulisiibacteriota bacterium]